MLSDREFRREIGADPANAEAGVRTPQSNSRPNDQRPIADHRDRSQLRMRMHARRLSQNAVVTVISASVPWCGRRRAGRERGCAGAVPDELLESGRCSPLGLGIIAHGWRVSACGHE
jgi:hypothetical protein